MSLIGLFRRRAPLAIAAAAPAGSPRERLAKNIQDRERALEHHRSFDEPKAILHAAEQRLSDVKSAIAKIEKEQADAIAAWSEAIKTDRGAPVPTFDDTTRAEADNELHRAEQALAITRRIQAPIAAQADAAESTFHVLQQQAHHLEADALAEDLAALGDLGSRLAAELQAVRGAIAGIAAWSRDLHKDPRYRTTADLNAIAQRQLRRAAVLAPDADQAARMHAASRAGAAAAERYIGALFVDAALDLEPAIPEPEAQPEPPEPPRSNSASHGWSALAPDHAWRMSNARTLAEAEASRGPR